MTAHRNEHVSFPGGKPFSFACHLGRTFFDTGHYYSRHSVLTSEPVDVYVSDFCNMRAEMYQPEICILGIRHGQEAEALDVSYLSRTKSLLPSDKTV